MKLIPIAITLTLAAGMLMPPCFALDSKWQELNNAAEAQFKANNFLLAQKLFIKAKDYATAKNLNQELGTTLFDMAWMYDAQKNYPQAEQFYSQLLTLQIKLTGDGSVEVAKVYKLLGAEQLNLKQLANADASFTAGLHIVQPHVNTKAPANDEWTKTLIGLLKELATVSKLENNQEAYIAYNTQARDLAILFMEASNK